MEATVSTESNAPVKRMTLTDRDAKLAAITAKIEALLYEAREAHTLGAATYVPFETLPKAWRQDLADVARAVVMNESLTCRQAADLHARAEITRWLKGAAVTAIDTVQVIGNDRDRYVVVTALDRFIKTLTTSLGPSIVSEVLQSYQESLIGGGK